MSIVVKEGFVNLRYDIAREQLKNYVLWASSRRANNRRRY